MKFKQLVYLRLSRLECRKMKQPNDKSGLHPLHNIILNLLQWNEVKTNVSFVQHTFRYQSKALYHRGLVIKQFQNYWEIQTLLSVPQPKSFLAAKLDSQSQANYHFQIDKSFSNPIDFIKQMGYQMVSKNNFSQVTIFKSVPFDLEIHLYSNEGYLNIIEKYNYTKERVSKGAILIQKLKQKKDFKKVWDNSYRVILDTDSLRPVKFINQQDL